MTECTVTHIANNRNDAGAVTVGTVVAVHNRVSDGAEVQDVYIDNLPSSYPVTDNGGSLTGRCHVDATKDFPYLVGWEISNEDTASTANTNWQEDLIDHINTYQTGNALQHLVMRTVCWPSGSNADLDASGAQLVSYNADTSSLYDGTKVAMRDTDHIEGLTNDYANVWYAMLIGAGGSWYMDEWDGLVYGNPSTINNSTYIVIRENLGYMAELTSMLNDMEGMTPQGSLSSTGYCLAKDHATAGEYIVYYDGSSTFTVSLTNATGTLNIRWLRCSDGTVQDTATVSGGANRTLTPPWTGRVVAYVRHI